MSLNWQQVTLEIERHRGSFLTADGPITVSRAPARLDVMGGIADYSGSLVLEGTLAHAAHAAVQPRADRLLRAMTVSTTESRPAVELSLDDLLRGGHASYADARGLFTGDQRWAGYVLGGLLVLQQEGLVSNWPHGLSLLLVSDIPIGAGVASSAAIEVAALSAITTAFGVALEPLQLAQLCQKVENRVVGAPCGIMDQVTSCLGHANKLLALRCQPCEIEGFLDVPTGYQFVGINSAVKHSVGGMAYGRVRAAAFMGHRIMTAGCGTDPSGGYWANVTPEEFGACEARLPEHITGREFLRDFGETRDTVTQIEPDLTYPVRQASRHPVHENDRVERFLRLLESGDEPAMLEAGSLMYESHASYSACGLGSDETDLLVDLVRERGPSGGLYGAKITGGGSGGTVAVLAAATAGEAIQAVREEYVRRTGRPATLVSGTSDGAAAWGTRTL